MRNSVVTHPQSSRPSFANPAASVRRTRHISRAVRWLAVLTFLLLATPKLRITIGPAPLYFHNVLVFFLFLTIHRMPNVKSLNPFARLIAFYLLLIYVGELHGLLIYGALYESVYMIGELSLVILVFFLVPRLVRNTEAATRVLKAIVLGLICTSVITIMYALGPTRPLVMNTVFSYDFLIPSAENLARVTLIHAGSTEAARGYSLIGPSTATTGVLGTMWAFAFLAANWPGISGRWRTMANLASIITPVAMLMTYGRAAWFTVVVIGGMSFLFGFAKSRRNTVILVIGLALVMYWVGWQSDLFLVENVVERTQRSLQTPFEDQSTAERLLSYTEPFSHLLENPLWLVAGAGRVGKKLSQRGNIQAELRDLAGLSTHSAFGMAYYCYGLLAAILHTLLMLNGFQLILRRLRRRPPKGVPLYRITWQAFLMAWTGLFFWWLPGHAVVGDSRSAMLFFLFYGFMMACDRMLIEQANEAGQK